MQAVGRELLLLEVRWATPPPISILQPGRSLWRPLSDRGKSPPQPGIGLIESVPKEKHIEDASSPEGWRGSSSLLRHSHCTQKLEPEASTSVPIQTGQEEGNPFSDSSPGTSLQRPDYAAGASWAAEPQPGPVLNSQGAGWIWSMLAACEPEAPTHTATPLHPVASQCSHGDAQGQARVRPFSTPAPRAQRLLLWWRHVEPRLSLQWVWGQPHTSSGDTHGITCHLQPLHTPTHMHTGTSIYPPHTPIHITNTSFRMQHRHPHPATHNAHAPQTYILHTHTSYRNRRSYCTHVIPTSSHITYYIHAHIHQDTTLIFTHAFPHTIPHQTF
ncbi:PREDICTED: uncharacterized protein LOC105591149 [Cercocebus atys]|uniref:uncharacterized protein LOC105591149 n=1 Tax=Cercocebus atys TaxID=9531 RepID=UPI0005F46C0F|nr:PREDICTED: uncharacterized protein LOC105591149 [Cercocebus atys]